MTTSELPRHYRSIRQLLDEFGILRGESLDRILLERRSLHRGRTTIWQALFRAGKIDRPTLQIIEITREGRITPEVARMCLRDNVEKQRRSGETPADRKPESTSKKAPEILKAITAPKPAAPVIRRRPASKAGLVVVRDPAPNNNKNIQPASPTTTDPGASTRNVVDAPTDYSAESSGEAAKRRSSRRASAWSWVRHGYCGRQMGRYLVSAPIGRGAMSDVFVATDTETHRVVALKVLKRAVHQFDDGALVRFRSEAEALRRVDSAHVVAPFDLFEDRGSWVLAMEHIHGLSVGELIDLMGCVGETSALRIVRGVAEGLRAALQAGIIHRDIKPHNILVNGDGAVKVCDFGLALVAGGTPSKGHKTEPFVGLGTPLYCPPEQAQDASKVDHRADIYSLGVTLFQMLVGLPPFTARSATEMVLLHAESLPDHLDRLAEVASEPTLRLVARMMAKNPEDRVQTYDDLLAMINACQRALPPAPSEA